MLITPKWVLNFANEAATYYEEFSNQSCKVPIIEWRKTSAYSSGEAWIIENIIKIRHGKSLLRAKNHKTTKRIAQKLLLCHEFAHCFTPAPKHDNNFWRTAWTLYKWAKIPMWYAKWSEGWYKKRSLVVLKQMQKEAKLV